MRGHDPRTFETFVEARYAALTRSAFLISGNHHDAEDLVQAALVKAVAVWPRIEDDPEPYIRRIIVNDNISRWRKHRGRELVGAVVVDPAAPEQLSSSEERVDLEAALALLTPKQRTVLVLRFYEDLTERQTAELMGVALGTVKSQTRDALAALRRHAPGLSIAEVPDPVH